MKQCKGLNGLKVHYSRAHKEYLLDFITRQPTDYSLPAHSNEGDQHQSQGKKAFKCRFPECSRSFDTQNGLKIHVAKGHREQEIQCDDSDFAHLIQSFKSGVKVIRRIPRGARISVAMKLKSLVNDCVSTNSVNVWQTLFLFAYRVLSVSRSKPRHKSLTKTIKDNALTENVEVTPESRITVSLRNIVESKVADGDIRGAIRILSSADSIAPENDVTFDAF